MNIFVFHQMIANEWQLITKKAAVLGIVLLGVSELSHASADHWDVRGSISLLQAQVVGPGNILMLGDSIVEQFWWTELAGKRVLNAGQGGAGIDRTLLVADKLLSVAKPSVVVALIGVNDCRRGNEANPLEWGKKYQQLLGKIHRSGAKSVSVTILPVEKDPRYTLGDAWFNSDCINALNKQIRLSIVPSRGAYVDLYSSFTVAPDFRYMQPGWTADGVHLGRQGSVHFHDWLQPEVDAALKKF